MQAHILPLNPGAAFERAGAARGLLPASREVDLHIGDTTYRVQVYRHPTDRDTQHIVYSEVGDWGNLHWFERRN